MRTSRANRERGAALLMLLAVIALGSSWYLVSRLNAESGSASAVRKARNAEVLNKAKQALIGYVAAQAANSGEDNPGALPCPEAAGYFDNPGQEGQTASSCTLPKVGRFPWRTIGTEKLVDSAGEPLWYVVSPGWAVTSGNTNINSNTPGQLTVNSVPNSAVALIIAPGPAFTVAAASGCAAKTQDRPLTATTDKWQNYLECGNATAPPIAATNFVTTGPSGSFNDQVLVVTAADILPGIEAAIAKRIEREIAPVLKPAYVGTKWNTSAGDTVFPFAASFLPAGNYQGAALTQGLLPFNYSPPCSPVGDSRCTSSTFHAWGTPTLSKVSGSGSLYLSPGCSVSGSLITCTGNYQSGSLQASFDDPVSNVANALRDFNLANHTVTVWTSLYNPSGAGSWDAYQIETSTRSRRFNSSGSLSFVVGTPFRWASGKTWGYYVIEAQRPAITDHPLLNPIDPPNQTPPGLCPVTGCTGWFVRNEWYRLLYYAVAPGHMASTLPPSCTTAGGVPATACLSVANNDPTRPITPVGGQRAILILAGRSINGSARPSSTRSDYLEFGNATAAYERRTVSASNAIAPAQRFNDRIVVIGSN